MNRAEAKTILLLYRTEADAADPQVAEALALVKQDPDLARWFADYRATQNVIRAKFREIPVPPAPHGQRMDLERAIALLPPGCRTVLVLHDVEGFTHEEIARQLGIAVGTSKSQLFAARRAARTLLAGSRETSHAQPG